MKSDLYGSSYIEDCVDQGHRWFNCKRCGTLKGVRNWKHLQTQEFCSKACSTAGENNGRFKGGTRNVAGYIVVSPTPGKQRFLHVLIAEKALGKPLPAGAVVHHHNEIKDDNRNANLVICENDDYHKLLHVRLRVMKAGGDPDFDRICCRCHKVTAISDLSVKAPYTLCRPCNKAKCRAYKDRKRTTEELEIAE